MDTVSSITFYTSIIIFFVVSVCEGFVISARKLKLDPSALITLSLYFIVMLIRFLRCFISNNTDTPLQIGISLSCHTLISMSMYYFVFEMQTVRYQMECANTEEYTEKKRVNNRRKTIVMVVSAIYGISYTVIRVLFALNGGFNSVEKVIYIITFTVKLLLDTYAITIFVYNLSFFLQRKRQALQKEALAFTPFNRFVLGSIYFLLFMRIAGSLYTFIIGIITLTPLYDTNAQKLSYEILDDLVFPIRDFVEVLFFSYLFFYQSKKRIDLAKVNQVWRESSAQRSPLRPNYKHKGNTRVQQALSQSEVVEEKGAFGEGLRNTEVQADRLSSIEYQESVEHGWSDGKREDMHSQFRVFLHSQMQNRTSHD